MEAALVSFASKATFDEGEDFKARWRRTDVLPFDSTTQYMATLNHDHNGHGIILVKGAPEVVLKLCRVQQTAQGEEQSIDLTAWLDKAEALARKGQRVLAVASRSVPADHTVLSATDLQDSLCLLGLVGLIDPPRQEAISAVQTCLNAKIQVKMITGDHAVTAQAIGKQLGLTHTDKVLTGTELDALSDETIFDLFRNVVACF